MDTDDKTSGNFDVTHCDLTHAVPRAVVLRDEPAGAGAIRIASEDSSSDGCTLLVVHRPSLLSVGAGFDFGILTR